MKNIKYKDYRIGKHVFTVKLTHLPHGGVCSNDSVKVEIMEWHTPPRNFWERITESWKYYLNSWVWDPYVTGASLDYFCISYCDYEASKKADSEKFQKEWAEV